MKNFLSFGDGDVEAAFKKVESGMKAKIQQIAAVRIRREPNRESALNHLKQIADDIKAEFENMFTEDGDMRLQEYYGVNIKAISITSVELSAEKKAALAKLDAQKDENKVRQMKMSKTKQMAASLVRGSKKEYPNDPSKWISFDAALKIVQINEGITPKTIKELSVDRHTVDAVTNGLSGILLKVFGGGKGGNK